MKFYIITTLIVIVFITDINAANKTWGFMTPFDHLLARDFIKRTGNWMSTTTETIIYPPKGHFNFYNLSCIKVWDRGGSRNFGYAALIRGGPGYRNATIYLKSQRNKPLNFTIEYFGH